jgi:hypothetical protein
MRSDADETPNDKRPPLQFSVRALLAAMVLVALLFGTLRWLDVSATASAVILVILVVGVLAAVGLLASIAGTRDDDP